MDLSTDQRIKNRIKQHIASEKLFKYKRAWQAKKIGEVVSYSRRYSIEYNFCRICNVEYSYAMEWFFIRRKKSKTLNSVKTEVKFEKPSKITGPNCEENLCPDCNKFWQYYYNKLKIPEKKSFKELCDKPHKFYYEYRVHNMLKKQKNFISKKYGSLIDSQIIKTKINSYGSDQDCNTIKG